MPPLQALAALHAFWILIVLVPTVVALRRWPPGRLWRVGRAVTMLGLLALSLAVAGDLYLWLGMAPPEWQQYAPQRVLFFVATLTEFPLLQIIAAGAVCWQVGRRRM
jgi:hypothetical protein